MHYQIAESEASSQAKPRDCRLRLKLSLVERRKFKKRKEARYRPKKKNEYKRLTAENAYLKEIIEDLTSKYFQVPARDPKTAEISVFHSDYDPNLYVLDHQGLASDIEGTADELLDFLELDDLLDGLLSEELTVNDPVLEIPISQDIQQSTTMAEFLMKIDEDVASNVDFPDFNIYLEGEHKTIGKYNFPLALVPTVERIINVHGDISAACLMNSCVTGQIYLVFCAAFKEMEDLELDQVTEEKMLKWRDAIKDALRINFKVDFAVSHLKNIARAYFGRIGSQAKCFMA